MTVQSWKEATAAPGSAIIPPIDELGTIFAIHLHVGWVVEGLSLSLQREAGARLKLGQTTNTLESAFALCAVIKLLSLSSCAGQWIFPSLLPPYPRLFYFAA